MFIPPFIARTICIGLLSAGVASGQEFPSKPIRLLAGAGGGPDFEARMIAQGIAGPLGQQVIVENRPVQLTIEFVGLDGVFAPAKTPAAVINRLNQEIVRYLRTPDAKEKFLAAGTEPVVSTPEELTNAMKSDIAKLSKLIKSAGIKAD